MADKNFNVNVDKLRLIVNKWKETNVPGNNIDINKLADFTLKIINSEPLIREICDAFLISLSIQAIKDPKFDIDTYKEVDIKDEKKHAKRHEK